MQRSRRPFGVAGQTAAGGVIGAAIGRVRPAAPRLTLAGAAAGAAIAHEHAVRTGAALEMRTRRRAALRGGERARDRGAYRRLSRHLRLRRPHVHDADRDASGRSRALAVDVRPVGLRSDIERGDTSPAEGHSGGREARPFFTDALP